MQRTAFSSPRTWCIAAEDGLWHVIPSENEEMEIASRPVAKSLLGYVPSKRPGPYISAGPGTLRPTITFPRDFFFPLPSHTHIKAYRSMNSKMLFRYIT
jgi:hypothetical protein